jgi:predicted nucleic acid-binding protein
MKIVSNSSPLIALAKIEKLDELIKKKIRISEELYGHALELAKEREVK